MRIRTLGVAPRPRRVFVLNALRPGTHFGVHNNSLNNLRRGLMERVYHVEVAGSLTLPPSPLPGAFKALEGFAHVFSKHVTPTAPMGYLDFVECYRGRRRTVYEKACASLQASEVSRADSVVSTFVKSEKINLSSKPDPAPRVIQPRHPRYNVEVGRFIKKIEHAVYNNIADVWGDTTVLKGVNAHQQADLLRKKWDSFRRPVAIGLDASRFDQHVSTDALSWEHSIYLKYFSGSERAILKRLLSWQLVNTGRARASDGIIKYKVNGCRMSGDMNTGLGNCLPCVPWSGRTASPLASPPSLATTVMIAC